ncbi:enoyl-CoA hydratase-related protein [Falsiroseomonas sp.]|uniref:enoyl-CoA hydratase-related protein n=1 Tax=Falsiroseomonas sp. TaxID=2870721 RepID=UPI003F707960
MGLSLARRGKVLAATLDAPARGNPLSRASIAGLHAALDEAEGDAALRILTIQGAGGIFCAGMDFSEATATSDMDEDGIRALVGSLYDLFERFGASEIVTVALVDGPATAGGLGLVAASDVAIATPRASFQLSEILFGLLPATVAPFLVRRMGVQDPYRMTLTAERMDAATALSRRLVDEVTETPADSLRRLLIRMDRVARRDVAASKAYFRQLWIMDAATRGHAIETIATRIADPRSMAAIRAFLESGGAPWRTP